ncbi:MAG: M4 family metallopeptidase [Flavobacteriaceae bacterium]|nr:M4 family metallopeptidase [Aequorivita sp.]
MKKINKFVFLFTLLIFAFSAVGSAQNKKYDERNIKEQPSLVVFDASQSYTLQNSNQIFKEVLNPSSQTSFTTLKQEQDPLGFTHQKMQEYFNGVKVEFATVTLSSKNGTVQSLNSAYFPIADDFNITPSISNSQAFNSATAHVGASKYMWQNAAEAVLADNYKKPTGELVILPALENISETNRLAYKFDIYATAPLYRADVYIDAKTGQFIMENKKIHDANVPATGTSLYNGNVSFTADNASGPYRLRQTADGNGIQTFDLNNSTNYNNAVDVTSSSTNFTSNPTGVQAHFGAERTHKYYSQKHGRNSYNNAGAIIKSYVSYSSNYVNAFWDGSRMTYGDGDGVNYGPLVSLDICGHEITHGVTEYSANLVYSYQSGALNESFSDIFGESIEKFASGTNDWLMGDDIGAGGSGGALRSMSNPNAYGDPDTYQGTYWYSGSGDSGGVHINSGVQNFWFYILTVGKSGTNDLGNSYNVTGIGMDKAAAIAYRNLTVYLNSNSQYSDARNGAIQAARDLYGADSPEEIATTNAWYAVGVGAPYGGGGGSSYCASQGNNVNDEYISRVQLNTINNASGAQFYSDFTSISTTLNEGATYTITVTPTWTGTIYNEGYAVWIDYNGDKDFGDAGELVWSKAASKNTPNSGTFTVPSGTIGGETRMRVSMKYNGIPTSCETFSYGEVEDYTINLGAGAPDTQAPTTPSNLVASNVTQTTLTLSWNASTDNVGVTGYDVFQGTTNIGSVTGTSANITGLSPSTAYSFKVRAHDAAGNNSGFSNTVNVTTPSNTVTYCTSQGNNSNDEYIDRVQLGSINNLSGNNGGYADFTSISTSLAKGSSNTITITPRWTGTVYREAYRVWIDYNQDGDFNDSGEQVYSRSRTTASSISGSFTVPTSALSGATRMRVSMKYNANPSSCETFTYGEVEDYTVIISNAIGQGITGDTGFSNAEMSIYPNPAKHTLNISLIEATGKDYVIYNTVGQVVGKGAYTENVDVSSLQSGIYIIEVNTENNKLRKRFVKE